jgi:hypothetical protein
MRLLLSAAALAGLMAAGCATQKTYETVLDVCSSGNGTVKSAKVLKSSGDPVLDKHAIGKVGTSMVYTESDALVYRPLTVEYRVNGEV